MADDESLLKFFAEERQFFDVLEHYLDQIDDRPGANLKEPLPEIFSNNPFGYLTLLLDRYQEQPYLLDPHLERMVQPIILRLRQWLEYLQQHSAEFEEPPTDSTETLSIEQLSQKLEKLSHLLYFVVKVRGYKTIVRFFPHQVQDLSIVISTFGLVLPKLDSAPSKIVETFSDALLWHFRYILLLWLSLICMIPFDLSRFDKLSTLQAQKISTYQYVEKVGWSYLSLPGKEREAAALVLARLMLREDVFRSHLLAFVEKCLDNLRVAGEHDLFLATGIAQVLCILVELARPPQLLGVLPLLHQALLETSKLPYISASINLRKLRAKLAGRVALVIPVSPQGSSDNEDEQVPESIEIIVQDLLDCLQDKDTVVRWSGAKYLAKIGRRLPEAFSIQICDAILELFSLKTVEEQKGGIDLLSVNDYTWQGACLACAEFLRQKCFPVSRLESLIEWVVRALHFEQRKGVQSIGSGVRDAAAFVLWSFGRAFSSAEVEPFANQIAIQLVLQSLFDREVHVRRAGSAAFQENVGRLGIFPHGIDVLQRADFFTVGLRRSSFLKAAPEVARFEEYREAILNHLLEVCVCHWDGGVRELASQSICQIARDAFNQIPTVLLDRLESGLKSKDINQVHGSLLTLGELAKVVQSDKTENATIKLLEKIFQLVTGVLHSNLKPRQLEVLLEAICQALANTLPDCPRLCENFIKSPAWMQLVDIGLKRSDDNLHCSLQSVLHQVSLRGVGVQQIQFFSKALTSGLVVARQASARCLGGFVFSSGALQVSFQSTFDLLIACTEEKELYRISRFNCGELWGPIPYLWVTLISSPPPNHIIAAPNNDLSITYGWKVCTQEQFSKLLTVFVNGLFNYTNDQRGDVGSWVRASSLKSLDQIIYLYTKSLESIEARKNNHNIHIDGRSPLELDIHDRALEPSEAHENTHKIHHDRIIPLKLEQRFLISHIFSGVLRQSLDSIDSVRQLAWQTMAKILVYLSSSKFLQIDKDILVLLQSAFDRRNSEHWRELKWTFPNSVDLLTQLIKRHLQCAFPSNEFIEFSISLSESLLQGIIILIGGKGNNDAKKAAASFVEHIGKIGESNPSISVEVVRRILKLTSTRPSGSRNFGLCCWETISLLLETDALKPLEQHGDGRKLLQSILHMVTRNLNQPKVSVNRVLTGSKMLRSFMALESSHQRLTSSLNFF
ncbi:uncharacterized protein PGTG_16018 [Puccinia graminis f. sp. tritici CRL 75-36-700-3]|uniref:Uncharacterized protein n=1 Tax=Puccinia graminis f. sp. tritici (strain CRL 75-36-700-3 / race SCCL) TaxID=418459 RepID=E3L1K6_PUCGT|nr:uncharacterized protein PGTG_16018 [Puccinia graminis f. sp. tritici CRL 75-36-700-3]EFP90431.2 hypothetical protein PGTG_16018 [Puccinia graminis f. sp. tritici CRL 75-36-700-3]